VSSVQIKKI